MDPEVVVVPRGRQEAPLCPHCAWPGRGPPHWGPSARLPLCPEPPQGALGLALSSLSTPGHRKHSAGDPLPGRGWGGGTKGATPRSAPACPLSSPGARSALRPSVDTARWRPCMAMSGPTFLFSHLAESGDRHLVEPRRKYILETFFLFM